MFKILSKTSWLTLLVLAIMLNACKKDDPEPTTEDKNEIVGKWQLTSIKPEASGTTIPAIAQMEQLIPCIYSLVFTFESNNKVTPSGCDAATAAMQAYGVITVGATTTWKVESGKLKLTNGSVTQEFPITQQTTTMTLTVNTQTDTTKPAVNAILNFKKL